MRICQVLCYVMLLAGCGGKTEVGTDPTNIADGGAGSGGSPGADAGAPGPAPAQGQKIVFELSRVNYAWGESITGIYVTADGAVFAYDYFGTSNPDGAVPYTELKPGMTEAQVTEKFGSAPKQVASVDHATLSAKFAMLGVVRNGTLLSQFGCADYGEDRYVGYLYDPAKGLYTPVPLGIDGDLAVKNTEAEGDELIDWLRSLGGDTGDRACRYSTSSCEGPVCGGNTCEQDAVPMGEDGAACLEYCGPVSRCHKVDGCSACAAAKDACVVEANGTAHCVRWVPGCTDAVDCACGGDSICAAGAGRCEGTAQTGLSCAPL